MCRSCWTCISKGPKGPFERLASELREFHEK